MKKFLAFFSRGKKGLYFSDGRKLYFPDRDFKDVTKGLAEVYVDIGKDKGNYAFVKGNMIEPEYIDMKVLANFLAEKNITGKITFLCDDIRRPLYVFATTKEGHILVRQLDDKIEICFESDNSCIEDIYFSNSFRDIINRWDYAVTKYVEDIDDVMVAKAKELSKEDVLEWAVRKYSKYLNEDIMIYDNKYIVQGNRAVVKVADNYYPIDKDCVQFNNSTANYKVSKAEIEEFMIQHNICLSLQSGVLASKTLFVFDKHIDIMMFNNSSFKMSFLTNGWGDDVKASREKLETFRKQIGKYCTSKSSIEEISKLLPRNYLGITE